MAVPVVPPDAPDWAKSFCQETASAIRQLETPMGPTPLWACLEAALPAASITYANMAALVTDKKCAAVCTYNAGAWAWTRADGSAL